MEFNLGELAGNIGASCGPSRGWLEYFPGQAYSSVDIRAVLMRELVLSLQLPGSHQLLPRVIRDGCTVDLPVNVDCLREASVLPENFFLTLATHPRDAISCLAGAVYDTLFGPAVYVNSPVYRRRVHVMIFNYSGSVLAMKSLRATAIDRLISVRGTVLRVGQVKPLVVSMNFTCSKCKHVKEHVLKDGIYSRPTGCGRGKCMGKTFAHDSRTAKLIDFQVVKIGENRGVADLGEGMLPRSVDCEFREDLVDACRVGDVVTVCGFVKSLPAESAVRKTKDSDGLHVLYIEAISVANSKDANDHLLLDSTGEKSSGHAPGVSFSPSDLKFVAEFAEFSGAELFRNILHSICPSIYGHELVKAGIALALFGGVQQNPHDESKLPLRGDIHMLIVGDPGLGKSQLLKAAASVAQRGVYVCGTMATTAGLGVAVRKDPMTGDHGFEVGALALADRGMCCIDEFDKMSSHRQVLLESMEQQCISIAKAGVIANFPARTSVLAAANPVGGRYNRSKTVHDNLKINAALLSRFDLVFILLDKPDEVMDRRLTEHVLALHARSEEGRTCARVALPEGDGPSPSPRWKTPSLPKRLKFMMRADEDFKPLPKELLRKYVAYAREYVHPRLSDAAGVVLKRFYLGLRKSNCIGNTVTVRKLESLIRLAQARAKIELRDEITEEDALDVVDFLNESSFETLVDEHGSLKFGGSGALSLQEEAKRFLDALQRLHHARRDAVISSADLYSVADAIGLRVKNLESFVGNLCLTGYLLKKGSSRYVIQPSSCEGGFIS